MEVGTRDGEEDWDMVFTVECPAVPRCCPGKWGREIK